MKSETTDDDAEWHVLIERKGESYEIDGYRSLREAWDEAEADLIKMGWLKLKDAP